MFKNLVLKKWYLKLAIKSMVFLFFNILNEINFYRM